MKQVGLHLAGTNNFSLIQGLSQLDLQNPSIITFYHSSAETESKTLPSPAMEKNESVMKRGIIKVFHGDLPEKGKQITYSSVHEFVLGCLHELKCLVA